MRINDLKISIERTRDQLQKCRNERVAFEKKMDVNSCEEHHVLAKLYRAEQKLGSDLKLGEEQLLEERRRFRLKAIAALGVFVVTGISLAYVTYAI